MTNGMHFNAQWLLLLVLFVIAGNVPAADPLISPPTLTRRTIAPDKNLQGGPNSKELALRDGDMQFTLFVPQPVASDTCRLTIHFHTAAWFIIQEHVRRGATNPLACFHLGEGSTVYRRPFEDRDQLNRCISAVEKKLGELGSRTRVVVSELELSSFSAGYGAIREIVKSPDYRERIKAIVLADSMYGSLETNVVDPQSVRSPAKEHVDAWVPFARAAMSGSKTFVLSYSEVPTATYASSSECADALARRLDLTPSVLPPKSEPATTDLEFPLLRRVDSGGLHLWGYGGTNAQAHMTHARHLADLWRAIEKGSR